jgi:hypothetical protein
MRPIALQKTGGRYRRRCRQDKGDQVQSPERRASRKKEEKPRGPFAGLSMRRKQRTPPKELTPGERFQQGFRIVHSGGDYLEAIRAFAKAIQLETPRMSGRC